MPDTKDLLSIFADIISLATFPTLLLSVYLYFKDPLKRWTFLGYLPTAVLIIFDPNTEKVLLIKTKTALGFPQGVISGSDITKTVEQILRRELGVGLFLTKILYAKNLGKLKITDKYRIKRLTLGNFAMTSKIQGKGYIAFYLATDLKRFSTKFKPEADITNYWILKIADIKKKLIKDTYNPKKKDLLIEALVELENHLKLKKA